MRRVRWWAAAAALAVSVAPPAHGAPGAWAVTHPVPNAGMASGGMYAYPDGSAWVLYRDPTEGPQILRSRDFGATWEEVPAAPSARGYLLGVLAMASNGRGWAVGQPRDTSSRNYSPYDGGILVTADGAASWRHVPLPRAPRAVSYTVNSLRTSPSGASAVVTGRTHDKHGRLQPGTDVTWVTDGGRTTRRTTLGTTLWGWSVVSLLDDRSAIVMALENHWTGERWLPGTPCCDWMKTGVYVTRDAGRTWRKTMTVDDEFASVDWVEPDRIVTASQRHGTVFVSRDGGRRFGRVGAVRLYPAAMNDDGTNPPGVQVDFVNGQVGFANACHSGMWRTENGGETWDIEPSPNHGNIFVDPTCSAHGIAAADEAHAVSIYKGGLLTRMPG